MANSSAARKQPRARLLNPWALLFIALAVVLVLWLTFNSEEVFMPSGDGEPDAVSVNYAEAAAQGASGERCAAPDPGRPADQARRLRAGTSPPGRLAWQGSPGGAVLRDRAGHPHRPGQARGPGRGADAGAGGATAQDRSRIAEQRHARTIRPSRPGPGCPGAGGSGVRRTGRSRPAAPATLAGRGGALVPGFCPAGAGGGYLPTTGRDGG